ncbi:MAG: hypothetical protein F4W90_06590 [Gammaproteobacteria bacterium]|nr:hypothetical protein [Gammaproteobacteria bacterium]
MAKFPSVAWFDAVRDIYNTDDELRGAGSGTCNCTLGVQVGREFFQLTFEGFECSAAEKITKGKLDDCDFYLHMPAKDWRTMLSNIRQNGHATYNQTLNTLDLDRPEGLSTSTHNDQYREDMFFRYNQTLQFFFNASARINTTY